MSFIHFFRNVLLVFSCVINFLSAQDISTIAKSANYKKGDVSIYFSPLALIEPRPTLYLGGEYFIKDRLSFFMDMGYMINITGMKLNTEVNRTVSAQEDQVDQTILHSSKANYALKPEIRWYRQNSSPKDASYYALRLIWRNANYLKNQRVFEEYAYSTLTNSWTAIGSENISIYQVRRQTLGLQFVIGRKDILFKGINTNVYTGVGVRYISNSPSKKAFNPFENIDSIYEDLNIEFLKFNKKYKIITMDFALGVRFGGRVKR